MPTWLTVDIILKALAMAGAALAFLIGLKQYRRAQQWKRAEWVAQEMKELLADPLVHAVTLMIDWESADVPLYPDQPTQTDRSLRLNDAQIAAALADHKKRKPFENFEVDVRNAFDRLLFGLERFSSYVTSDLVSERDLEPYLSYWAKQVCPKGSPAPRIIALQQYMETYGFSGAYQLLQNLAREVNSTSHK